jgi:hypothetical protein
MPWKECSVMDERLRLWRNCAGSSESPAKPATSSVGRKRRRNQVLGAGQFREKGKCSNSRTSEGKK